MRVNLSCTHKQLFLLFSNLSTAQAGISQPLLVPASSTATTLPTADLVIRSDTGGEVHVRLGPCATLSDLQDMLWRHFHIDAHLYNLVVRSVPLEPATPLTAQGVTNGCSIVLKRVPNLHFE